MTPAALPFRGKRGQSFMSEKVESHLCHLLLCTAIRASVVTSGQRVRRAWESSSPSNRAGQGRPGERLRRPERPVGAHVLVSVRASARACSPGSLPGPACRLLGDSHASQMLFCIKDKWPSRCPSSARCSRAQEGTRRLLSRALLAMLPRPQVGGSWTGFSAPRQHCRAVCSRRGMCKWAKPEEECPRALTADPRPGGERGARPALVAVPPGCCHAGWEARGDVPRSGGSCSVLGPEQVLFVSGFFLAGACRPLECAVS